MGTADRLEGLESKTGLREGGQEGGCVKDKPTEVKPATVPLEAKQAGEVWERWPHAKPWVWTERMLLALEKGVKGGQWFSLIDKIYEPANLRMAFYQVKENRGGAGVDHETIEMFEKRLDENLERLGHELKTGTYRPRAIRRVLIPKPGSREKRPLGIPAVRDRVVQTALREVLEPIFERDFSDHSYGFRPGRGCRDALREVDGLLKGGYAFVVDADLKSYFDSIPTDQLLGRVKAKISDSRVLSLIEAYLNQEIMHGPERWTPEQGTPQGAVISPLLSNIYLDPLDHLMEEKGYRMVRYADDFVILCHTRQEADEALDQVRDWAGMVGLALHPDKTGIVDVRLPGGFDFLGYHFEQGDRWPRKKSLKKYKDAIRAKTRRTNGLSMEEIILSVNQSARGWFGYFKHSHKTTFPRLDSWTRMRLRSILRRRSKRKGRGRGRDHQRWPNAFFAERGLFLLAAAHAEACQSA